MSSVTINEVTDQSAAAAVVVIVVVVVAAAVLPHRSLRLPADPIRVYGFSATDRFPSFQSVSQPIMDIVTSLSNFILVLEGKYFIPDIMRQRIL